MSDVLVSQESGVVTITMNRSAKKNAITAAMYGTMADAIVAAEADTSIRAILIQGTDGVFTAGNDLQDFLMNKPSSGDAPVWRFMASMVKATVPIIAAVDGFAIGIGTTMLFHCDQVIMAKSAVCAMPFTDLALVPEFGSSLLLPQQIGYPRASDLILTGRKFFGQEAYDIGIATKLVDAEDLEAEAQKAVAIFTNKPPGSVRKSKQLLRGDISALAERVEVEAKEFGAHLQSAECNEALTAFMEKRKPDWSKFG